MRGFGFVDRPPSHEKDAQGVTKDELICTDDGMARKKQATHTRLWRGPILEEKGEAQGEQVILKRWAK